MRLVIVAIACLALQSGVFAADGKVDTLVQDVFAKQAKRFEESRERADKLKATKADRQLLTPDSKKLATRAELLKAADSALERLRRGDWAGPAPMLGGDLTEGSIGHLAGKNWTQPHHIRVVKVLKNDRFIAEISALKYSQAYAMPPAQPADKSPPFEWTEFGGRYVFEGFGLDVTDGSCIWLYEPVVVIGETVDIGSLRCRAIRPISAVKAQK